MTIVHAELSATHDSTTIAKRVAAMAAAVPHLPLELRTAYAAEDDTVSVVVATQSERPGEGLGEDPLTGSVISADVRLDERRALATSLGIEADPEALSDPELILAAYRTWGADMTQALVGDGVFVLWDEVAQRLLCWRDVAGTRPIYYRFRSGQGFVISTDLRTLVAHPEVDANLDLEYAAALLRVGPAFQHPTRTLVNGVMKLPASHLLIARRGQAPRISRYWNPADLQERRHSQISDYVVELRSLLETAVQQRIEGAAPIASHLSGGLDSSSVAVTSHRLTQQAGGRMIGLSWAPPYEMLPPIEDDERPLAQTTAAAEGIDLRFTAITAREAVDIYTRDHALSPGETLIIELAASRIAVEAGAGIILSGWGGDELVVNNGKGYFADLARRGRWATLWREMRLRTDIHESSMASMIRGRVIRPILPDPVLFRIKPDERPADFALPTCLRPEFAELLNSVKPLKHPHLREQVGVRKYQIAKLEHGHLQYRMESWAAHGLDIGITYRYPLLDRRLIEFALSIPDHLYFKNGWKRWLYRTAMEGILPDQVRWFPHKTDRSMMRWMNQVVAGSRDRRHAALRERSANPFVDVDRLLASQPDTADSVVSTGPAPDFHATWLPFTGLTLP